MEWNEQKNDFNFKFSTLLLNFFLGTLLILIFKFIIVQYVSKCVVQLINGLKFNRKLPNFLDKVFSRYFIAIVLKYFCTAAGFAENFF